MYTDNEILFPHYAIPVLRNQRGAPQWAQLIERLLDKEETSPEILAFMEVMITLNGCLKCETDSYRALRGCTSCAKQELRRFKGSDAELLARYERALDEFRGSSASKSPTPP